MINFNLKILIHFCILLYLSSCDIPIVGSIVDRVEDNDISRSESRSLKVDNFDNKSEPLPYLVLNNEKKKVPSFRFINQNEEFITDEDYLGKVYIIEFFFTTCTTICPIMNTNLVHIQNSFTSFQDFGIASFTINPEYDKTDILKSYAQENGIVNWNAKEIRKNYLKLWFTIDLIASIPLELFVLMISILNNGVDSSQLQLKLLLRMLKLPRLFRMGRIFKYLERFKYASTMRIIRLLVGYVLAGHWVACGFLFVCRLQDPYETVTFLHEIHDKSILAQYLITLRTAFFFFSGENVEVQTVGEEICKYFNYIHTLVILYIVFFLF